MTVCCNYFREAVKNNHKCLHIQGHISIDLEKYTDLKTHPNYISSCPVPEVHKSL